MSRRLAPVPLAVAGAVLVLLLWSGTAVAAGRAAEAADDVVPGSYIVLYEDSVGSVSRETDRRERQAGFKSRFRYRTALKGFSARLSARQVAELRADPEVDFVSPNRRVRALGALSEGELMPSGVQRMLAGTPNPGGTANGASSVGVAVIDTGIDLGHPDLDASAVDGTDCVTPGTSAEDDNGHGTHVAGTIAAENDAAGVVGVAPGTTVYAVKVLDAEGGGTWDQIICGINWTTANADKIEVANMSLGGLGSSADNNACGSSTALHEAICKSTAAGVRYAVAAGNDAWPFPHSTAPDVPAAYREVVTVAASSDSNGLPDGLGGAPACRTGEGDEKYASFSNWSNNATDNAHTIAAPGVCIRSTWPRSLAPAGGYDTISGTSMASPHVAGALARCIGEQGADGSTTSGDCVTLTAPAELVAELQWTEVDHGYCGAPNVQPVSGRYYGYQALAGAEPATRAFAVCATPASRSVTRGNSTSYTVNVPRASAYSGSVTLSVSGLPSGATATFSPNPVTSSSTSATMKVSTRKTAPRGTYTLTVKGADGAGAEHGNTAKLTVK